MNFTIYVKQFRHDLLRSLILPRLLELQSVAVPFLTPKDIREEREREIMMRRGGWCYNAAPTCTLPPFPPFAVRVERETNERGSTFLSLRRRQVKSGARAFHLTRYMSGYNCMIYDDARAARVKK